MTDRALMRRALDALSASVPTHDGFLNHSDTIAALRERLARSDNTLQCWDYSNPEHGALDADMLADYFAENMRDDTEESFRVMVSVPQPDRIMVVRLSGGDERTMTWRWWEE